MVCLHQEKSGNPDIDDQNIFILTKLVNFYVGMLSDFEKSAHPSKRNSNTYNLKFIELVGKYKFLFPL
jgi:hypothetical protein